VASFFFDLALNLRRGFESTPKKMGEIVCIWRTEIKRSITVLRR
jgi:hypothetical protein